MRHSPAGSLGEKSAEGIGEGVLAIASVEALDAANGSTATFATAQAKQIAATVPLAERTRIVGPHAVCRIPTTISDVWSMFCTVTHIPRQFNAVNDPLSSLVDLSLLRRSRRNSVWRAMFYRG